MGCLECSLNFVEVKLLAVLNVADVAIVRMVFEPGVQVSEGFHVLKLIRKADAESKQTIQIVRVTLMRFLEGEDCKIVLVILLVKLAENPPGL